MVDSVERYYTQFSENENLEKLIRAVEPSSDSDLNLALVESTKITKTDTVLAVAFLKQHFVGKYGQQIDKAFIRINNIKKSQLFGQLITFVQLSYPTKCLICDDDYTPLFQAESANGDVECIKCKVPAHNTCYKYQDFNVNQGKVFMCQMCLQTLGKEDTDKKKEEVKEKNKEEIKIESGEEDSSSDEDEEENSSREENDGEWEKVKKKKRSPKKSPKKEQICPKLMEGNCEYGASGKGCKYLHKKKCNRFINYGTTEMHRGGCRFGERCHFLHPTMCQNSLNMNSCYNDSCKLAHLRFTKRRVPRNDNQVNQGNQSRNHYNPSSYQQPRSFESQQTRSYERQRSQENQNQGSYKQQNRWMTRNNQQYAQHPKYNAQNNNFLDEMKKLRESILQSVQQMINTQLWGTEETYDEQFPPVDGEW